jgi:hypothetical protein
VRSWAATGVVAAALAVWCGRSVAAPELALTVEGCGDVGRDEVARIVRAERGDAAGPGAEVTVTCAADGARIQVAGPAGVPRTRVLDLSATAPIARARLLALAVVELLARPDPEPERPAPARPVVAAMAAPRPAATRPAVRALAVGYARLWQAGLPSIGGGVRVTGPIAARLRFLAEALADQGVRDAGPGRATIQNLGLGAGLLVPLTVAGVELAAGAGARLAATRLVGSPDDPTAFEGRTITAPSGGPLALLVADVPVGRWVVHVGVDGGWVALPVEGDTAGVRSAAVTGWWAGAAIGVGLRL